MRVGLIIILFLAVGVRSQPLSNAVAVHAYVIRELGTNLHSRAIVMYHTGEKSELLAPQHVTNTVLRAHPGGVTNELILDAQYGPLLTNRCDLVERRLPTNYNILMPPGWTTKNPPPPSPLPLR